ncbi:MAG: SurA N-terminal domain-containing protein [Clostridiales bacterium]|nr:SurA N-terminal domain-containing protein [Clostridiales bacterium]
MKRLVLLLMLLVAVFALSGCNLIGHDDALDRQQTVASVNGEAISKGEWLDYRSQLAAYYQQMYKQYGISATVKPEDFGDDAIEQLIQEKVLAGKMTELGIRPMSEEDQKSVESYADSMVDLYKTMIRYQNYPNLETVEEEEERLAAAKAEEASAQPAEASEQPAEASEQPATEAEPAEETSEESETDAAAEERKATVTNAELDEMLLKDLAAVGYTREYFIQNRTASQENEKLRAHTSDGIEVSDEEVEAEEKRLAEEQKTEFDETPTEYAEHAGNGDTIYYIPEGYRGVQNLLIAISDEDKAKIDELNTTISDAEKAISDANSQLETLRGEEASKENEEEKAAQIASLEETVATQQAALDEAKANLETVKAAAFEAIRPAAEAALERVKAGEDFVALMEELGKDTGMASEPNKTRGYLVCEGLTQFVEPFQQAAMALSNVGDTSDLVETQYGYHILRYAGDIEPGMQEITDEQKESLREDLLKSKQDAAYESAVSQWTADAKIERFPKVMK